MANVGKTNEEKLLAVNGLTWRDWTNKNEIVNTINDEVKKWISLNGYTGEFDYKKINQLMFESIYFLKK